MAQKDKPGLKPQVEYSYLESLKAIRDRLTAEMKTCTSRELAGIAKQLRETLADIKAVEDAAPDKNKETAFYAIQKGRTQRVSGTSRKTRSASG